MSSLQTIILNQRPAEVGFPGNILSQNHPLTSEDIRSKYTELCPQFQTLVWANSQYSGIKIETHELTWRTEQAEELLLSFSTPAKGAGYISLVINTTISSFTLFVTKKYDVKTIEWAETLCSALKEQSPFKLTTKNFGADC